ncbi:MAG: DUF4465 domain-containing protein [Flavipsychrobacter sp.]|nr:DUF4465 domain-containing protein [Flavipsychrobacter sp.]
MRRITLLILFFVATVTRLSAQTVSDFESQFLPTADTFYVDASYPGMDNGFYDGFIYYPCVYDTTWQIETVNSVQDTVVIPQWNSGFVYSNVRNIIADTITNQAAAITDSGYLSNTYAVAKGNQTYVRLVGPGSDVPLRSMMITNSTYAYLNMRDGKNGSKKFGGTTGTDPDYLKLEIAGYGPDKNGNALLIDTTSIYLANFSSSQHFVVDWQYVDLSAMGVLYSDTALKLIDSADLMKRHVDSLTFTLVSSDNSVNAMAAHSYFCIDNLTTNESLNSVKNVTGYVAKVYPNPATNVLYISLKDNAVQQLVVFDMAGHMVTSTPVNSTEMQINTSGYSPGTYILKLLGAGNSATVRFVKQ